MRVCSFVAMVKEWYSAGVRLRRQNAGANIGVVNGSQDERDLRLREPPAKMKKGSRGHQLLPPLNPGEILSEELPALPFACKPRSQDGRRDRSRRTCRVWQTTAKSMHTKNNPRCRGLFWVLPKSVSSRPAAAQSSK